MNRSDFFRRLGLAVAALFAPKAVEGLRRGRISITNCRIERPPYGYEVTSTDDYVLVSPRKRPRGDGIFDDTEAVQAMIDAGEPLPKGRYRVTRTLNVSSPDLHLT